MKCKIIDCFMECKDWNNEYCLKHYILMQNKRNRDLIYKKDLKGLR